MLSKAKKCIDCIYYPNDCGYWDNENGIWINGTEGRLKKDTEHNCQDFSKDYVKSKYGLEVK